MQDTIVLNNVTMRFDGVTALNGITLSVKSGEVVGILGSNGAGKSTTMKAIAGVLKPTTGNIVIKGLDTSNRKLAEEAKELTGYCPDVGGLLVGATPREHIQLLLNMHGGKKPYGLALALLDRIGLGKYIDTPVGGFSHGESRRLSVLLAALSAENVLVLDEPFDGVDPLGVSAINNIIDEAKNSGLAVVVSTHLQPLLVGVSDDIIIMNKGTILIRDQASSFAGDAGVQRYRGLLASV